MKRRGRGCCKYRVRLANDLEFVVWSDREIAVREPPLYSGSLFFAALGVLSAAAFLRETGIRSEVEIFGVMAPLWLFVLGLYCCVDSTYTVTRGDPHLVVRRSVAGFERVRAYPFNEVEAVIVRRTWRKGNGLVLLLASGKLISLTWSLHFQVMDQMAAGLTHAIRVGQQGHRRS
jgi:hypothetical protein